MSYPLETPDLRPGPYYVSAIDGGKVALVSGPYASHAAALADVDRCNLLACAADPRSHFAAFGTCRFKDGLGRGPGVLQHWGTHKIPPADQFQTEAERRTATAITDRLLATRV